MIEVEGVHFTTAGMPDIWLLINFKTNSCLARLAEKEDGDYATECNVLYDSDAWSSKAL